MRNSVLTICVHNQKYLCVDYQLQNGPIKTTSIQSIIPEMDYELWLKANHTNSSSKQKYLVPLCLNFKSHKKMNKEALNSYNYLYII